MNGKGISESPVNSKRIGSTLKLEAINKKQNKKFCHFEVKKEFYWCTVFHFILENKIIHILMYFTETRQLGLEQESAKYSNATKKGRALNKIHSNTWITVKCFTRFLENTS